MPFATSDGLQIFYRDLGAGDECLLFLHGLGDSSEGWQAQFDAFADEYRLLAPDVRGHGQSTKPRDGYSIEGMAADAVAVVRQAGVERVHVIGISMGGGVALEVAIQEPDLVASLTIVNSLPSARGGGLKGAAAIGLRRAIARLYPPSKLAPTIAKKLFPDPAQQAQREDLVRRLSDNDRVAYRQSLAALARFDRADESTRLDVPTLFISAEHDYTPRSFKQQYVDAMPRASIVEIAGAHHAVPAEKPEDFNQALAAFLHEVES